MELVSMASIHPAVTKENTQKILNERALITEHTRSMLHVNTKTLHFLQIIQVKYKVKLRTCLVCSKINDNLFPEEEEREK